MRHGPGRRVLGALVCGWLAGFLGCVVPSPIDIEHDAGINYPPVLVTGSDHPTVFSTTSLPPREAREFRFTVSDSNASDSLVGRIFWDYHLPSHPGVLQDLRIPPPSGPDLRREVSFSLSCDDLGGLLGTHVIEAVVADRPFVDDGSSQPIRRALPEGALSVTLLWYLECKPGT